MSKNRARWIWPASIAAAGLGSLATLLFRGCWHRRMGWPVSYEQGYSYQVCTDCGIKRLYDDRAFTAYGPFGYDVDELILRDRLVQKKRAEKAQAAKIAKAKQDTRSAS